MSNQITFTPEKRDQFRAAYNEAVENGEDVFEFEGNEVLVDFAKYLLIHLDNVLATVH
jgi:hypothetical protein